jgi:hypothetical protein
VTERTLVVDDASGAILRTIIAPPGMLALNVAAGESLFVVANDDGLCIDDAHVVVSELGDLTLSASAPAGVTAPPYELQYVAV